MPTLAKKVFLSSTFIDLVDYREAAIHAFRRVGLIPVYMEDFPPDPRDAISFCKAKVKEADLFLGIYAHRYGYVPDRSKVSITEMEYEWAIERRLPVHLFVIDSGHPWIPDKIDKGKNFERLERFKKKIGTKHTLRKFREIDTFKEDVLLLGHDLARTELASPPAPTRRSLPTPPEMHSTPPYIQTTRFIGRRRELDYLDAWARSADPMLVVEAIGGVGKSALTWQWAREQAARSIPRLAGILWWSFYEGGASTTSFVREALAYVTETDPEALRDTPQDEQASRLLTELGRHPYLLVLDGFERLLTAYHQLDPSKLRDDQVKSDYRACTNPRTEGLLRQLTACSLSKVLLTTRLMPSSLENRARQPVPGVRHLKLPGLDPNDGENLLRSLGIHGDSAVIHRFLRQFDNHSLLIGVLAGRILDYRPDPGNFDRWLVDPREGGNLRLSELDLKQRRTHILSYAFDGLEPQREKLLSRIAVLSDAADYATLSVLNPYLPPLPEKVPNPLPEPEKERLELLRNKLHITQDRAGRAWPWQITKRVAKLPKELRKEWAAYNKYQNNLRVYFESPKYRAAIMAFDSALSDLEDRGLLQWDRYSNTYDLHPVVRGYAFDQLEKDDLAKTYERIRDHFESLPLENSNEASELSQIKNSLQIYRAFIGAGQLDKAAHLYRNQLSGALFFSITSYPTVIEVLTPLFANGTTNLPTLAAASDKRFIANDLGIAFQMLGRTEEAQRIELALIQLGLTSKDWPNLATSIRNYSATILRSNQLRSSLQFLKIAQRISLAAKDESGVTTYFLMAANIFSVEGRWKAAHGAYEEFLARPIPSRSFYRMGEVEMAICRLRFWQNSLHAEELEIALTAALRGNSLSSQIEIHCLQAEIALRKGALYEAVEAAERAIEIARKIGSPKPYAYGCMARALALQGRHYEARKLVEETGLEDRWQAAEVYLETHDLDKAREIILRAYKRAWADGPPHIRWWELECSKRILDRLGIPEPKLPSFDTSKIEPMPFEAKIRSAIKELTAQKRKGESALLH
jgi:tetratricopeptide (TPR) repeat protein